MERQFCRYVLAAGAVFLTICGAVQAQNDPQSPPTTQPTSAPASDGERIARLQRSIEEGERQLAELDAQFDSPESDFNLASADFKEIDAQRDAKREQIAEAEAAESGELETLRAELEDIERRRTLARERLDLALVERRALQEQAAGLKDKLAQDRAALQKLLDPAATQPVVTEPAGEAPATGSATQATEPAGQPSSAEATGEPAPNAVPAPPAPPPAMPGVPAAPPAAPAAEPAAPAAAEQPEAPESEELQQARQEAAQAEQEARQAEQEAATITERIATQQHLVSAELKLRETARQREANARETERTLMQQMRGGVAEGAPQAEIAELLKSIDAAREAQRKASAEARQRSNRLDELQAELAELQAEQIAALEEADRRRAEAAEAQRRVAREESPFSPQNLWRWTLVHGPRIVGVLVGAAILMALVRLMERKLVYVIAGKGKDGSQAEREARARTLMSVFHNTATLVIVVGAGLMVITELGLNIVPLMGGVAVVGLAVAFGAQNLIRDYFTGFMVLLENQYSIGDVVKIGDNAGLVERITLRITVLRDLEGTAHFIPNGQITSVRNLTHGWSQAVIDIRVSYSADLEKTIKLLRGVAQELRADATFRQMIIGEPEVLGVDALTDSAVVIRMLVKTRPLQQWTVKRAFLYRIKKRLDESGIEIPLPQRVVHLRGDGVEADGDGMGAQPGAAPPGATNAAPAARGRAGSVGGQRA